MLQSPNQRKRIFYISIRKLTSMVIQLFDPKSCSQVFRILAILKLLIFFCTLSLKNRQKNIYDITLMIYLRSPWTVESALLGLRDTCSPFEMRSWKDILRFRKGKGYDVDLLETGNLWWTIGHQDSSFKRWFQSIIWVWFYMCLSEALGLSFYINPAK